MARKTQTRRSAKQAGEDHYIVDLRKVSTLPNGDMVQQRPPGFERPDTIDVSDLERQAILEREKRLGAPGGDPERQAFNHAATARMQSAQDIVDQAAAAAAAGAEG